MSSAGMFGSTTIPILGQVLSFTEQRHNVLAGNIANFDTPGYRVRDLSPERFQARLKEALSHRDRLASTGSPDMAFDRSLESVSKNFEGILYHDQSNGSVEEQVAEIAKNQLQHNLAIAIMSNQFRLLQAAISERA